MSIVGCNFPTNLSEYECAFVKYFKEDGPAPIDPDTTCKKLTWETSNNLWKLAEIDTIYRIIHVAQNYSSENGSRDKFLLNKFLFR